MAKRKEYCSKNVNEPFNQELVRDYKWQQMHPLKDEDFLVHMKLNKNNKKAVNPGDNHLKKANKDEIEEVVQQVPKVISLDMHISREMREKMTHFSRETARNARNYMCQFLATLQPNMAKI